MSTNNDINEIRFRKQLGYGNILTSKVLGIPKYIVEQYKSSLEFDMAKHRKTKTMNTHLVNKCETFIDFAVLSNDSLFSANKHSRTLKTIDAKQILLALVYNKNLNKCVVKFFIGKKQESKAIVRDIIVKAIMQFKQHMQIIRADRVFNEWLAIEHEFNIKVCVVKKSKQYPYNANAERNIGRLMKKIHYLSKILSKCESKDVVKFLNAYADEILNHNKHSELKELYENMIAQKVVVKCQ